MPPTRDCRKLTIRIYDPSLVAWLDTLSSNYGEKSKAIAAVMKRGLDAANQPASAKAGVDFEAALPAIRQVVEAAVATALGRFQIIGLQPDNGPEEPDAVEVMLQRFDESVLLDEDDA